MTTGLTYNTYVQQICTMAVLQWQEVSGVVYPVDYPAEPTNLQYNPSQILFPQMITYAENRIYRDLDFLFTSISTTAYGLTAGNRQITVPAGTFVVPEQINLITPSGTSDPNAGTRVPLLPTTKEFLDQVYGSALSANRGEPKYFAPFGDFTFLVGPYPALNYTCEIVATYRPNSLGDGTNGTTTTTFISLYLPDLFIMASMIYISAYQRNFGRANDDPQMAMTYESQYQALLKSAMMEENRKKFEAAAWSSQSPSTAATPTRG